MVCRRRKPVSAAKKETADEIQGKADHGRITALQPGNPKGSPSLKGIGAGFVHGLTGSDIIKDLSVRNRTKRNIRPVCFCNYPTGRRKD